jgi:hypothetical protein
MAIWSILWPFEIFYGHLEYFVVIWYIFPRFGILDQEKSGNPGFRCRKQKNILHIYWYFCTHVPNTILTLVSTS